LNPPLLPYWLQDDNSHDVVLSTRFRLARNLPDVPFPNRANPETKSTVKQKVHTALRQEFPHWRVDEADTLAPLARELFFEMHLVSSHLKDNPAGAMIALSPEARAILLVNEEDHLRLQLLLPGLALAGNWRELLDIENRLARWLDFAFHPQYGYLTACVSNVGTGLRASVMLHLPGLVWSGNLASTLGMWPDRAIEFRGLFGEGSSMDTSFIQLSNKTTLGADVETIVRRVIASAEQLVSLERRAREQILNRSPLVLEDRVFRSFGILRSARLITSSEATAHLSLLRLGSCLDVFPNLSPSAVLRLLVGIRPAHLQIQSEQILSPERRDEIRAVQLRSQMDLFVEERDDG
jgi:protein arginine kinase